eukprot:CAMPEP_0174266548 /NCGR_PEP_ID=MMETSP0439-20130205/30612_1 /TAXON_ID=0 /ORGANISM="Stereomyxa ramosa, Strain Chinc5" /LENGTH=248 /DNA_ID=CAMNT_0015353585 /DNA_START=1238 /DNA_END=1984 /DNA_ORIENTATION=-
MYGLTEAGVATVTLPGDPTSGETVGAPIPSLEIKLVDIKNTNYKTSNDKLQGEICIRGPALSIGYYKLNSLNSKVFTTDGWCKTGDIGELCDNGALAVIGRLNSIVRLNNGEHIPVEKLECIYSRSQFVHQVFVEGNNTSNFLVAIVVVRASVIMSYAKKNLKIPRTEPLHKVLGDARIKSAVLNEFNQANTQNMVSDNWRIKDIYLDSDEWDVEAGLVTPSPFYFLKRTNLRKKYKHQLKHMLQTNH